MTFRRLVVSPGGEYCVAASTICLRSTCGWPVTWPGRLASTATPDRGKVGEEWVEDIREDAGVVPEYKVVLRVLPRPGSPILGRYEFS